MNDAHRQQGEAGKDPEQPTGTVVMGQGGGSTTVSDAEVPPTLPQKPKPKKRGRKRRPGPITVLLVDDDPDCQAMYRVFLEHVGYRVLIAGDGEAGLQRAVSTPPDVILLDIMLPKIAGWEVAHILRQDERTREIPIIAMTAYGTAEDPRFSEELGIDNYLQKPVEPRRVYEEIKRVLGLT